MIMIPERYKNAELNDKTECIRLLKKLQEGQGGLLCGKYGCGKTYALYAYAKNYNSVAIKRLRELQNIMAERKLTSEEYAEYTEMKPVNLLFINANKMFREIKNFDKQDEMIDEYKKADLLLIDDIGSEYAADSGYFQSILDEILDCRYNSFKTTVLSSNLSIEDFKKRYGGRITDRIKEWGFVYESNDKSLRGSADRGNAENRRII